MKETDVQKHFLKYKKVLIKKHGRKALDNFQLEDAAKPVLKNKFLGVFPQDKVPIAVGYIIANTDKSGESGTHWVGLYCTNKTVYVYDSFARETSSLLKILTKKLKGKNIRIIDSDRSDAEQYGNKSEICGVLTLAWLFTAHDLGIRNAIKI